MVEDKQQEEYELVPLSPLRKLEKRLESIESSIGKPSPQGEMLKEIVDVVRMNQQLVDEMSKATDALRVELSKIPNRLDTLIENLNELLSYIKESAKEEISIAPVDSLIKKMNQLIEENKKILESNQSIASSLENLEKKFKRPVLLPMKKPMFLRRPIR